MESSSRTSAGAPGPGPTGKRFWLLAAGVLALAAALRAPALGTDLWLDEIWSLEFAKRATSARQIVFGEDFRHDNNHHLNTIFLRLLGEGRGAATYRSLAFVSGLVAVAAALILERKRSPLAGLFAGLLVAASFFEIVYSTEARGYGPAVGFALLSILGLRRFLERPGARWALAFSACAVAGFAAHLASLHVYFGALFWSSVRLLRGEAPVSRRLARLAALHALPLAYLAVLWFTVVRALRIGGGNPWNLRQVADEALAWTLGYPVATVPALAVAAALAALLALDLVRLARRGDDVWILHLGVIVLAPALTLTLLDPPALYPRYFLLPLTFVLLAVARTLAAVAGRRGGALGAATVLALFAAGNVAHLLPFWEFGRGGYRRAIEDIAAASSENPILVGVDHEFRTRLPVFYNKRFLPTGRRLRTLTQDELKRGAQPDGVEWFIVHSQEVEPELHPRRVFPPGVTYGLFRHYPYHGPSGMHWLVYRKE